jgi:hypothetical protein
MIRLWLQSNTADLVIYQYQVESGAKGEIWYSKSRKATKIDNVIDDYPHIYYQYLHAELMKMGEQANFPPQKTIAWY